MNAKEHAWIERLAIATKRDRGKLTPFEKKFCDAFFPQANANGKMMKGLCKRAGIHHYGFHALRHFMASYLADRERVGTQAVSKLLRHKNLRTTVIYLHSLDEIQRSAMTNIEGKFTSNLEKALTAPAHTKKKGATENP